MAVPDYARSRALGIFLCDLYSALTNTARSRSYGLRYVSAEMRRVLPP